MSNQIDNHERRKEPAGKAVAFILAGAILGSVLGGGTVGIVLKDQITESAVIEAQQSIDDTLSEKLTALLADAEQSGSSTSLLLSTDDESDQTVEKTSYASASAITLDYSTTVQNVAEKVMPSVVGVRTIEQVNYYHRGSIEVEGIGTGVIVSSDGLILTNQHVVSDNPTSITVTLMDGSEYEAQVLYADENMDLAVIKIDAQGLTAVDLGDSDTLTVGEVAIAIGNPLGLEYERSVTAGIVSALDRSILISQTQIAENLIQTDAAINSGNSGGPLLNEQGQIIGINTYKLSDGEGMGFAIPINAAIPIIEQIIETGTFQQVQIGVSLLDRAILSYYDMNDITLDHGLYVYNIDTTSDAYAQGLKTGDVITHIDGMAIDTLLELRSQLYSHVPGDTVTITVERDGQEMTFTVKLTAA